MNNGWESFWQICSRRSSVEPRQLTVVGSFKIRQLTAEGYLNKLLVFLNQTKCVNNNFLVIIRIAKVEENWWLRKSLYFLSAWYLYKIEIITSWCLCGSGLLSTKYHTIYCVRMWVICHTSDKMWMLNTL